MKLAEEIPAENEEPDAAPPLSVLHRVYVAFADAISEQENRKEVADRLRLALLKDGAKTEAALRTALFGSDAP